jgi:hypothetical protein
LLGLRASVSTSSLSSDRTRLLDLFLRAAADEHRLAEEVHGQLAADRRPRRYRRRSRQRLHVGEGFIWLTSGQIAAPAVTAPAPAVA